METHIATKVTARLRIARLAFLAAVLLAPWLVFNFLIYWFPGVTRRPVPQRDLLPPGAVAAGEHLGPMGSPTLVAEIPGMTEKEAAAFYEFTPPKRGWTVTKPTEGRPECIVSRGRDEMYLVSFSYQRSLNYARSKRASADHRAAKPTSAAKWKGDTFSAVPRRVEAEGPAGTAVFIRGNTKSPYETIALAGALLLFGLAVALGAKLIAPRRWDPDTECRRASPEA